MDTNTQKEIAIKCLEMLDVYKPYINKFNSEEALPSFFEHYAGFYVSQDTTLYHKIREIESEYGCIVYALTHEMTDFGECWSMLCVPQSVDAIEDVLDKVNHNEFYAFAYVWNKSNPILSEFGDIVIKTYYGGITRIF